MAVRRNQWIINALKKNSFCCIRLMTGRLREIQHMDVPRRVPRLPVARPKVRAILLFLRRGLEARGHFKLFCKDKMPRMNAPRSGS